jgi:hypothetical protein
MSTAVQRLFCETCFQLAKRRERERGGNSKRGKKRNKKRITCKAAI